MLNATKLTVLASMALSLVGLLGLVSVNHADAATSRQDTPATTKPAFDREDVHVPARVNVEPQTASEVTIVGKSPWRAPKGKQWRCGAWETLANDATQQVRVCEWR